MLKDLPVHTRQSLYRCLDITSESWIENEPELTWAKYTGLHVSIVSAGVGITINGFDHSLFDVPQFTWWDQSCQWRRRNRQHRVEGPHDIMSFHNRLIVQWGGGADPRSFTIDDIQFDPVVITSFKWPKRVFKHELRQWLTDAGVKDWFIVLNVLNHVKPTR